MRKYAISKAVYGVLIFILLCLSIGYTYAYFSAMHTANSNPTLGKINIVWNDNNNFASMQSLFDKTDTEDNEAMSIAIAGELKRSEYTQIKANNKDGDLTEVKLEASNALGTVGAYCRIKITATYVPANSEDETSIACEDGWIQLALDVDGEKVLITDNGWFYQDGYYYYGSKTTANDTTTTALTEISSGGGQVVADYLYLSSDASASMFGASVKIILTLEGVQTTNDAYKTVWGL